jgi:hypothetical protein
MAKRFLQEARKRSLLVSRQGIIRDEAHHYPIHGLLNHLVLADRRCLVETMEADQWPVAITVRFDDKVSAPAENPVELRQPPTARTRSAELGVVADIVANNR